MRSQYGNQQTKRHADTCLELVEDWCPSTTKETLSTCIQDAAKLQPYTAVSQVFLLAGLLSAD
jgi:hypothetical protein